MGTRRFVASEILIRIVVSDRFKGSAEDVCWKNAVTALNFVRYRQKYLSLQVEIFSQLKIKNNVKLSKLGCETFYLLYI